MEADSITFLLLSITKSPSGILMGNIYYENRV